MNLTRLLVPMALLPVVASAQTTVFNADFGHANASLNPSTYEVGLDWTVASTKSQVGTGLAASGLSIGVAKSSSALEETQARVLSSPVTLSSSGDYITLQFTFTNANLLGSATSSLTFGLFDSHGVNPRSDLSSSGLTATADNPLATGGAQGWTGYATRFLGTGSPTTFSRSAQTTETATESQDLLFNDVGSGAFDSPTGTNVGSATSSSITLTANGAYTVSYTITRNGTGGLDFSSSLYSGTGTGGSLVSAVTGTTASPITNSFDSLAIGFRETANITNANPLMKITAASLTTNVSAIPEPSAFAALAGAAGLAFAAGRRRRSA